MLLLLLRAGHLPKLCWCSIGRNPAAVAVPAVPAALPRVERGALQIGQKLGQGASGEVFLGESALNMLLSAVTLC
jgi:hypothetical protein